MKTQMKIQRYALALDVGGTFLKSALISSKGSILEDSFMKIPIDSKATKGVIIGTFIETMQSNLEIAEKYELEVAGIGIGTPGPFNYDEGISLMKHKFRTIYGLNLKREFMRRLSLEKGFRIRFEVDAWSFLRGEAWLGAAQGYDRTVGVTLGTGLGSAFMANNQIVMKGPGVPPHAWIGGLPNNNGIVEDKISQRGILARYKELSENKISENLTVREIALRGKKNNERQSLQVFEELGSNLSQVLKPVLSSFNAQCLVLGGQISKSFSLFESQLKNNLQSIPSLIEISQAQLIDRSALYGATKLVFLRKVQSWGVIGVNE